jgi:hypothetical protein
VQKRELYLVPMNKAKAFGAKSENHTNGNMKPQKSDSREGNIKN